MLFVQRRFFSRVKKDPKSKRRYCYNLVKNCKNISFSCLAIQEGMVTSGTLRPKKRTSNTLDPREGTYNTLQLEKNTSSTLHPMKGTSNTLRPVMNTSSTLHPMKGTSNTLRPGINTSSTLHPKTDALFPRLRFLRTFVMCIFLLQLIVNAGQSKSLHLSPSFCVQMHINDVHRI